MSSGGGGPTATSTSGIAPEFKPQLKRAVDLATKNLEQEYADPSRVVADARALQPGVAASEAVSRMALQGIDPAAQARQYQNLVGNQYAAQQGSLGSARAGRAREAALADAAVQMQQADLAQRAQGAQGLLDTGQLTRGVQQQQLDAPHTALQRYFGYLGNVGQQNTQQQSGGGK